MRKGINQLDATKINYSLAKLDGMFNLCRLILFKGVERLILLLMKKKEYRFEDIYEAKH